MMDDAPPDYAAIADRLYAVLRDFPSNGQLNSVDPNTRADLILAGYVEQREANKACPTCGTPRLDHRWFHITGGGRLFMAVMERTSVPDTSDHTLKGDL